MRRPTLHPRCAVKPGRTSSALAIAAVGLLVAGCGSSSPGSSSSRVPQGIVSDAYRYSSCIRDHGVPNFPDPQVSSSPDGQRLALPVKDFVGLPKFQSATNACRGIMPAQTSVSPAQLAAQEQARRQDLVAFARCLRRRGLTTFPDPTSQGQLTLQMVRAAGIDLQAPGVLAAGKACIGVTRGAVTLTDVQQAVNGSQG